MGGCCCKENDRSEECDSSRCEHKSSRNHKWNDIYDAHLQKMSIYDSQSGDAGSAAAVAEKSKLDSIRYRLEYKALTRFIPLRNMSSVYIFLLIISFIMGAVVGYYYHGAIGDSWGLISMNYFVGGILYGAYRSAQFGLAYSNVIVRLICYVVALLLTLVYIAFRSILIVHCNDPSYLSTHPTEETVCTDSYGAIIGVLVYGCIQAVFLIALIAIDSRLVRPAKALRDFSDAHSASTGVSSSNNSNTSKKDTWS